ncbi:exonuclease SbcC [Breznakibacter xylanolyticus]|uniref:Exonuclease SbcC n=1 Tax=Breznakibacter xylanolyticus TaxID=990 RepID=A0A2W7NCU0_9BACT|nr:SMC family ATPase [Breznakibacter xylanolyticus]PZX17443.1 exonuclease SbcC [Breznakibacter xylanolyticus]
MIPIQLTLRGLYSYRHTQTIDFATLTNAGLFGLFGGVGSGKSTILEAITFALYGESERLNARDSRNYNMMNLKSNDLLIDFEFRVGQEHRYRFTVTARRNGKKFEEVKSVDRAAYKYLDGTWMPLSHTDGEQVTGLSYNNFRRTIIIPQGKFQEFLQLTGKERTDMLKQLFNLERFELSGRVMALENDNNALLQNLQGQMQAVATVTPEQLMQLRAQQTALAIELNTRKQQSEALQKHVAACEQLKNLTERQHILTKELDQLLQQEGNMTLLNNELKEYEQMVYQFQSDIDQLRNQRETIAQSAKQLATLQGDIEKNKTRHTLVVQQHAELLPRYDKRDELLRQADELAKLIDIRNHQQRLTELAQRTAKGQDALTNKVEQLSSLKTERQQLHQAHQATRASQPDMHLLTAAREWFTHHRLYAQAVTDIEQQLTQADESSRNLTEQMHALLQQTFPDHKPSETHPETAFNHCIDQEKQRIALQQQQRTEARTHLQVQQQLNQYATALEDGAPCPLCGATQHPHIPDAKDVSQQLAQLTREMNDVDARLKTLLTVEKQMAGLTASALASQKQHDLLAAQLAAARQKLQQHQTAHQWPAYPRENEKALEDAFEQARLLTKLIEEQATRLAALDKAIEKSEQEKEKYAEAIAQLAQQQVQLTTLIETLSGQIMLVDAATMGHLSSQELSARAEDLKHQHAQLTEQYKALDTQKIELEKTRHSITGQLEATQQQFAALTRQQQQTEARIADKLQQHPGTTLLQVEAVLQKQLDVAASRQRIDHWHREVATHRELVRQTRLDIGDRHYNAAEHAALVTQQDTLTRQLEEQNRQLGTITTQIAQTETHLAKQGTLRQEIDRLEKRATNLATLKNLFRGSGFVNYVSTVYLQNLADRANERFFHLTRQRLALELASDNTFVVRDYMNEGKTRSVKTLSGGQTFQAALSLALALADSIQHKTPGSENFFFLDEGFGTLDKEALNMVFDTLKSLRKENRIVGVISHVEEMQQEIDTYLLVTNLEETGSVVKESWG